MNLYVINFEIFIVFFYLVNLGKFIIFYECWVNDKNIYVYLKLMDIYIVNIINRVFYII